MTIDPSLPITDAMHVKREIEMFRRAQEAIKELRLNTMQLTEEQYNKLIKDK